MQFEDETLRGAIRKALGKSDDADNQRPACTDLEQRISPIERSFDLLMSQIEEVRREIERVDDDRNPIMRRLFLRVVSLISRARSARAALRSLRMILRGRFGRELLSELKKIFDFLQELRDFTEDVKSLWSNLTEWEVLQNKLIKVSNAGRQVFDEMTQLQSEIRRLDCANLAPADTEHPMS